MPLSKVSTEDLIAELHRRGSDDSTVDATAPALAMVARVCLEMGFSPPREGDTLADWADEILDHALAPRGGEIWARGHEFTIDAMEAALEGAENLVRSCVAGALEVVRAHGNAYCMCVRTIPIVKDPVSGRGLCAVCHLRRRD